jgi:hypothetical protein
VGSTLAWSQEHSSSWETKGEVAAGKPQQLHQQHQQAFSEMSEFVFSTISCTTQNHNSLLLLLLLLLGSFAALLLLGPTA